MRLLEKKVNYAEEMEAPMILGMKILKKLEKDWGKSSDIYYEIEDILIDFGSDSPRRLAMALRRTLENYDMLEAPYKGYVNKIEKWVKPTGKVNESLYSPFDENEDEEIILELEDICEELGSSKLKLFFNTSDAKAIEKKFSNKIRKTPVKSVYRRGLKAEMDDLVRPNRKSYKNYVATFYTPNSGYGNRYACVLSELEFTGYGVSSNVVCELSFEEFYDLLKYFKFEGGEYVRDDYKSLLESHRPLNNPLFRKPVKFIKTYKDDVYEILDSMINDGVVDYADLEDIYNNRDINNEIVGEIASLTNYSHSDGTKRYIVDLIGQYFEESYQAHLEDVNESEEENKPKSNSNNRTKRTTSTNKNGTLGDSIRKNKENSKKPAQKKSGRGKAAVAGAIAGATYLAKKYVVDPISKSLE